MGNEGKNFDLKKIHFPVDFCCFNDRVQQKRISNVMTVKNWLQMEYCKHTGPTSSSPTVWSTSAVFKATPGGRYWNCRESYIFFIFIFFSFSPQI